MLRGLQLFFAEDLNYLEPISLNNNQLEDLLQAFTKSTKVNEEMEFLSPKYIEFPRYKLLFENSNGNKVNIEFYNSNYFKRKEVILNGT